MHRSKVVVVGVFVVILICVAGCVEDKPASTEASFNYIQEKIFNTSCALSGCHSSTKDAAFSQHGLLLTEGEAYQNLLDKEPKNAQAKAEGMKLLMAGNVEKSLLLRKLNCNVGQQPNNYGSTMPLGKDPLSAGQIEYITEWIRQGAPEKGMILADVGLLEDAVPVCIEEFKPLEAPAAGTGYQLKIETFDIKPNFEREIFVYKQLNNAESFYVNRIDMRMRRNSHHFLVNTFEAGTPTERMPGVDEVRELRTESGQYIGATVAQMEYQVFAIASQTPELNYQFPAGVALKMPANHKLDVNLHYVNKGTNTIQGECYINLYKANPSQVVYEAQPIFISTQEILLRPNQKTVVLKTFNNTQVWKVFMLTSHTHKLGERFEVQIAAGPRKGEVIYASSNWHHPTIETYDPPLELKAGEGLTMVITYNNTTDQVVRFGLKSTDEMGIIFGYYY